MFYNHIKNQYTTDAVEEKNGAWYIQCGFSGFNSRKNNFEGYKSKKMAEAAILRYQSLGQQK